MAKEVIVKLRRTEVAEAAGKALERSLTNLALAIEGQAKVNIQGDDLIDTGFLINSAFTITGQGDTFGQTQASGQYTDKQGRRVKRERIASPGDPGPGGAIVGFAANYAGILEQDHEFLGRAVETVAGQSEQYIVQVADD